MKKAVHKVQLLKNMSKIIATGDSAIILKKIIQCMNTKTEEDLQYCDKHFQKLFSIFPSIRKYHRTEAQYYQFLQELSIEQFDRKEVVFAQGDIGRKMYFILDGTILVFPYSENDIYNHRHTKEMGKGEFFGELSLHHRIPRTATMVCKTNCTLIMLNYDTYQRYLHAIVENQMHDKYDVLKPASLFHNWSQLTLSLLMHHLKEVTYVRNQFVYKQNDLDLNLYVIKSGEVCLQKVTYKNGKKTENGLVCLSIGQCFGDYEFLTNQGWYRDREQLQQMKRTTEAKVMTLSEIYQIPLQQYLYTNEEYHPSVLRNYLKKAKPLVADRIVKMNEHQQQQQKLLEESSSTQSLIHTIKNKLPNKNGENKPGLEPLLLKFDRSYKILLMKTLRDRCNIQQPMQDTLRRSGRGTQSSLQKFRSQVGDKSEEKDRGGLFIKSYNNSQLTSPNTSQSLLGNINRKTVSFHKGDKDIIHNTKYSKPKQISFHRSASQGGGSILQDSPKKYFKFEINLLPSGYKFRRIQ